MPHGALLGCCFLALSSGEAITMLLFTPDYFPREGSLPPDRSLWDPSRMIILLASPMIILFLPSLLGLVLIFCFQQGAFARMPFVWPGQAGCFHAHRCRSVATVDARPDSTWQPNALD